MLQVTSMYPFPPPIIVGSMVIVKVGSGVRTCVGGAVMGPGGSGVGGIGVGSRVVGMGVGSGVVGIGVGSRVVGTGVGSGVVGIGVGSRVVGMGVGGAVIGPGGSDGIGIGSIMWGSTGVVSVTSGAAAIVIETVNITHSISTISRISSFFFTVSHPLL